MRSKQIFPCVYCGKTLDLTKTVIKSAVPNPKDWSHYNTKTKEDCRDKDKK